MSVPAALSFYFGDDKTKSILSVSKPRAKNIHKLNVRYKEIKVYKQSKQETKILLYEKKNYIRTSYNVLQCAYSATY